MKVAAKDVKTVIIIMLKCLKENMSVVRRGVGDIQRNHMEGPRD